MLIAKIRIVSIRDAPVLVLYRTTDIKPIPALLVVSANSVVCVHIIDHKDISISSKIMNKFLSCDLLMSCTMCVT